MATVIGVGTIAIRHWVLSTQAEFHRDALVVSFSLLLVLARNWTLPGRLPDILRNDSILTLSVVNGILLFVLSLTISLFCVWVSVRKTRYLQRRLLQSGSKRIRSWLLSFVRDLVVTFTAFWLAMTVVPQFFYMFYRIIIPGLPLQWVITPLSAGQITQLLVIEHANTLSAVGTGLLFGTLLVTLTWSWLLLRPKVK